VGGSVKPLITCNAGAAPVAAANLAPGTPVRPTSIMVIGATGTLGRQVVRRALDEGYDVRCLVRPRPAPADFLRDWGATVVNGDLTKPETIPATLVGVHTIIDCATGRPEEPIKTVDWEGKVALIQCAKAMGIQKYVFFSIHNCDKHPEVPLMEIKYCTEKFLQDSGINHVVIRLCGFMQGLIGQYAVPILEEKSVWGTDAPTRIAYMDTQDIARLTFIALRSEKVNGKLLTFAGPRAWTTQEVITLCERLAGQDANVTTVPVSVLKFTRQLTRCFEWTNDVADRLAFSEILTSDTVFSVPMNETYQLLGVDQKDILTLEKYLQDYFTNILKKLKDLKAQSKQNRVNIRGLPFPKRMRHNYRVMKTNYYVTYRTVLKLASKERAKEHCCPLRRRVRVSSLPLVLCDWIIRISMVCVWDVTKEWTPCHAAAKGSEWKEIKAKKLTSVNSFCVKRLRINRVLREFEFPVLHDALRALVDMLLLAMLIKDVSLALLVDTNTKSEPEEAPSKAEESHPLGSRVPLMGEEFEASEPLARIAEVSALSTSSFRKRYRSSYETPSPSLSLTLPVQKRYRGTSELIEDTRDDEGQGLGDESHGLDVKSHGLDDEGQGLEDEGPAASEPLGLGYGAARRRTFESTEEIEPSTYEVGQSSRSVPEQEGPDRTPLYPEWSVASLPVSPSSLVVPSHIPSLVATPAATISRLDTLPPTLFKGYDKNLRELYTRENHDLRRQLAKERHERLELTDRVARMEKRHESGGEVGEDNSSRKKIGSFSSRKQRKCQTKTTTRHGRGVCFACGPGGKQGQAQRRAVAFCSCQTETRMFCFSSLVHHTETERARSAKAEVKVLFAGAKVSGDHGLGGLVSTVAEQMEFDYSALALQWPPTYYSKSTKCYATNGCCRGKLRG
nr:NAD(P)-binding domain-containing protein [Tanacetum cinerariifolium]